MSCMRFKLYLITALITWILYQNLPPKSALESVGVKCGVSFPKQEVPSFNKCFEMKLIGLKLTQKHKSTFQYIQRVKSNYSQAQGRRKNKWRISIFLCDILVY